MRGSRHGRAGPIEPAVKGLEKLTSIRLAEILSEKGLVTGDAITDALYQQDASGDSVTEILVASGKITEWDLAKVVAETFQLPFLMASNYDIAPPAKKALPEDELFGNLLVPLDMFDNILTVAMPILTFAETVDRLQRKHNVEFFPYVGLPSENKKILTELFPHYPEWVKKQEAERERRKRAGVSGKGGAGKGAMDSGWMNIFDSADAKVREATPKKK